MTLIFHRYYLLSILFCTQEIQPVIAAAVRVPRAPSKCSVYHQECHNKSNCPRNNNDGLNQPQRVGSRPVEKNGNSRALEPQDLDDEDDSANSSHSGDLNGDQSNSDDESDGDWNAPDVCGRMWLSKTLLRTPFQQN